MNKKTPETKRTPNHVSAYLSKENKKYISKKATGQSVSAYLNMLIETQRLTDKTFN